MQEGSGLLPCRLEAYHYAVSRRGQGAVVTAIYVVGPAPSMVLAMWKGAP